MEHDHPDAVPRPCEPLDQPRHLRSVLPADVVANPVRSPGLRSRAPSCLTRIHGCVARLDDVARNCSTRCTSSSGRADPRSDLDDHPGGPPTPAIPEIGVGTGEIGIDLKIPTSHASNRANEPPRPMYR